MPLSTEAIDAVIRELVGPIVAVGVTEDDDRRRSNLAAMRVLINLQVDRIYNVTPDRDSSHGSVASQGKTAVQLLRALHKRVGDMLADIDYDDNEDPGGSPPEETAYFTGYATGEQPQVGDKVIHECGGGVAEVLRVSGYDITVQRGHGSVRTLFTTSANRWKLKERKP